MCFDYDYEPVICASTERVHKTRKPHRCDGCGKMIPAGSSATNNSGLFDGKWFSDYTCDTCQRMIYSIVAEEIREGCRWDESWCAPWDLRQYLHDRTKPVEVLTQETLEECRAYLDELWTAKVEANRVVYRGSGLYSELDAAT